MVRERSIVVQFKWRNRGKIGKWWESTKKYEKVVIKKWDTAGPSQKQGEKKKLILDFHFGDQEKNLFFSDLSVFVRTLM